MIQQRTLKPTTANQNRVDQTQQVRQINQNVVAIGSDLKDILTGLTKKVDDLSYSIKDSLTESFAKSEPIVNNPNLLTPTIIAIHEPSSGISNGRSGGSLRLRRSEESISHPNAPEASAHSADV